MSTWEPEETPSPEDNAIPEPTFAMVWRGYDPRQVSEYLRSVRIQSKVFENRARELESELEQARMQGEAGPLATAPEDPYETISDRVAEVVRAFDQDVEQMRRDAEAEAQRIVDGAKADAERESQAARTAQEEATAEVEGMLAEARAEGDRIRVDAQAKAEEIRARAERALEDARARADALLSDLDSKRTSLLVEIRTLHDRMLEAARGLEPVMEGERADHDVVVVEDAASDEVSEAEGLVSPER